MIHREKSDLVSYILFTIISLFIFIPFLGNAHLFDWDEANFAEAAREMLITKDYMRVYIDYEPFWEKPPFFIWMQAISMKIFGVNEFAARLPNALAGVITVSFLYYVGKQVMNKKAGLLWSILYVASWLPHFYFKSGIIDPIFNLFIFAAFYQLWRANKENKGFYAILSGFMLGGAVLTKGPAAILIAVLCCLAYIIWNRGLGKLTIKNIILVTLSAFFTTAIWFGIDIIQNGWWFTNTFIEYQIRLFSTKDAGHGGPFYYHWVVLLIGCFPASILLFQQRFKNNDLPYNKVDQDFVKWMQLLLFVTLVLFSIVKTKIVHYSSLCYFPLTFIAAKELFYIINGEKKLLKRTKVIGITVFLILGLIISLLPVIGNNLSSIIPLIKDDFVVAMLQAGVKWEYSEILYGMCYIILGIITLILIKKGNMLGYFGFFAINIIMIEATIVHFTPKIEAYSQRASIEFFEEAKHQKAVVYPLHYKSYAYLFYSDKMPINEHNQKISREEALEGYAGVKSLFVSKSIHKDDVMSLYPRLNILKEKNGFILYELRK